MYKAVDSFDELAGIGAMIGGRGGGVEAEEVVVETEEIENANVAHKGLFLWYKTIVKRD